MLLRWLIYGQVAAIGLTGLATHWDRVGTPESAILRTVGLIGMSCVLLLPVFPLAVVWVASFQSQASTHDRIWALALVAFGTVAHYIAALPAVQ